jgi:uncharacterized membrane protein YccC
VAHRWQRFLRDEAERVRTRGPAALRWSVRITAAATLSYVVATLIFPGTQPLLAPLTAMVVIQVAPVSLLVSGLDRVVAVVAGVSLAVGFAALVPLEWWSLGLLLMMSITIGQFLRLRSNLVEVGISAMLVLGVGSLGASDAAWQRIAVTLVGAVVGIAFNLLLPPKVPSSDAGAAVDSIADDLGELLTRAASELEELSADDPSRLPAASRVWLADVRRISGRVRDVDAELLRVEELRRLNLRAIRRPHVEPGLRQGLEALEHTALAVRSMMRAVVDVADSRGDDGDTVAATVGGLPRVWRRMADGIDAFGELVRNEGDVQVELSSGDVARLRETLDALRELVTGLDEQLAAGGSPDALELLSVTRSTVRRLLDELDLEARLRRQLGRLQTRRRRPRPVRRRDRPDLWAPAGPDDETQPLHLGDQRRRPDPPS